MSKRRKVIQPVSELERSERMKVIYRKLAQRNGARVRDLELALTAYRLGRGVEWETSRCQAFRLNAFRELMNLGDDAERFACISEQRTYVDGTALCRDCAELLGTFVDLEDGS